MKAVSYTHLADLASEQQCRPYCIRTDCGKREYGQDGIHRHTDDVLDVYKRQSKARVGKVSGIIDPVFGILDGYGAYFQNLYATRNVNIAGTRCV